VDGNEALLLFFFSLLLVDNDVRKLRLCDDGSYFVLIFHIDICNNDNSLLVFSFLVMGDGMVTLDCCHSRDDAVAMFAVVEYFQITFCGVESFPRVPHRLFRFLLLFSFFSLSTVWKRKRLVTFELY